MDSIQGMLRLLSTRVRYDPLHITNKEFHSTIIIFGPETRLWIVFDLRSGNQEAITKIVEILGRDRLVGSSKNSFDSYGVDAISANNNI